jgi:hypothetical protein
VMRCRAEVSMIVRTMELQATTGRRIKLIEYCNMRRVEVAVGDQTSGRCCRLVSNEQMLSMVFSCGTHGD